MMSKLAAMECDRVIHSQVRNKKQSGEKMKSILKNLTLCSFMIVLGWMSASFAQNEPGTQNNDAAVMAPAMTQDAAPSASPVIAPASAVTEVSPVTPAVPVPDTTPVALSVPMTRTEKDAVCTRCHDENEVKPILAIYQTKHGVKADTRTPACQSCHGESKNHLSNRSAPDVLFGTRRGSSRAFAPSDATVQNEACLSCHKNDAKRSHWEGSTHQSRDVACASCHEVHNAHDKVRDKRDQPGVCFTCHKEQRAQINKPSHHPIPEGKMTCTDCHNPHGSVGPKLMKRDSVNDTCYACHMEKRGPFVHEHQPVSEDCTTCHNPHGTTAESMLKMRPPFLCNSCHTPHAPIQASLAGQTTAPSAISWLNSPTFTQGRGCLNCHTQVHGSNNPSSANPASQNLFR